MKNRATKVPSGSIFHRTRNGMGYSLYSIELQRSSAKAMSYYLVKQLKNMFIFNSDNFLDMIPGSIVLLRPFSAISEMTGPSS